MILFWYESLAELTERIIVILEYQIKCEILMQTWSFRLLGLWLQLPPRSPPTFFQPTQAWYMKMNLADKS